MADCPSAGGGSTLPAVAARRKTTPADPPKRKAGRPPVDGETRSVRLLVKCTPEEHQRWHDAAKRTGVDLAPVVRQLLDEWAKHP